MTVFADVIRLLDAAVDNGDIGAHGPFWSGLTRDQFVAYQVFGQVPLIATDAAGHFSADDSNLIKALEGRFPFGKDMGVAGARYPRMPRGFPPMSAPDIQVIRDWISAGCTA